MSDPDSSPTVLSAARQALADRPDDPAAMMALGNALAACGCYGEAADHYSAALALRPDVGELHYNLANMLMALDRLDDAEIRFRAALERRPDHAGAHNNLGNLLRRRGRHEAALESFARTLALRPDSAGVRNNLGATLMDLRRSEEAVAEFEAALAHDPDFVEAANHLGGAMLALDRLEAAQYWFTYALARAPDHAQARFGAALALLAQGDFAAGWRAYEARLQDAPPASDTPRWDGRAPIAGRTLLLLAEQGLGDTIQFVRYATLLRRRGAHVLLQCPPTLAALLAPVVDAVVPPDAPAPPHDLHCELMSLPMALDTRLETIPAEIPYLLSDPLRQNAWAERIGVATRPRVGIAWAGSPSHPEDDLRSLPVTTLLGALAGRGAELHAVQPEDEAAAGLDIVTHGLALTDFTETAGLLAQLDLVITVDTSVAHLAGAMAVPTWVLLQFSADFRWLRGRDDSPWYPGMRLFRQTAPGDWSGVLAAVATALSEHVAQRQIGTQRQ